jgi:hypothetical protein
MISPFMLVFLATSLQVQPASSNTTETNATTTAAATETNAEPETPMPVSRDDEMICRNRMVPSYRPGQRFTRHSDCRTRAEWRRASRTSD